MSNSIKLHPEPPPAAPGRDGKAESPAGGLVARELRLQTIRREISERRRLTQRLSQALAAGGFVMHYQPQIYLQSGLPRGAEAVIRLVHRRRGLILPSHFMPAAERSDVIHEIGGWSLNTACQEAAGWPGNTLIVAIRLSPRQIQNGRLIKYLIEALSRSGLAPALLELGLTEAMLIDDNEDTLFSLKALRGLGVRMALDDFGAGYASLSALQRLPLSTLKLDRSLIQQPERDHPGAAIVHAAIEAGHALGCSVLADGVESALQAKALARIGCDAAQGPFFSQAVPAAALRFA